MTQEVRQMSEQYDDEQRRVAANKPWWQLERSNVVALVALVALAAYGAVAIIVTTARNIGSKLVRFVSRKGLL